MQYLCGMANVCQVSLCNPQRHQSGRNICRSRRKICITTLSLLSRWLSVLLSENLSARSDASSRKVSVEGDISPSCSPSRQEPDQRGDSAHSVMVFDSRILEGPPLIEELSSLVEDYISAKSSLNKMKYEPGPGRSPKSPMRYGPRGA